MSTILLGVDATARSEDAVAFVRCLAPATTADVVVASIVAGPAPAGSPRREDAYATVRRMSGLLAGLDPERIRPGVVESRSPAQGLHELAEIEHAGLAVVGSTHTHHVGRVHPGSTGERLLIGAPCAVAIAPCGYRTEAPKRLKRIGVAYDGSSESQAALDSGIAVARALGARVEVITVIPSDVYGAPALMTGSGWVVSLADIETDIRKDLDAAIAGVPDDVQAEGFVLHGRPWRELADRSVELDLMLVGSRGYGPLQAVLLGCTSGPLTRAAHCPLIALPRGVGGGFADLFAARTAAKA